MKLAFRDADLQDRPDNIERRFVLDAWARTLRDSHAGGLIAMARWFAVMLPELGALVARPGVRTVVACDQDDDDRLADLFGFIVAEPAHPQLVYFVYVKEPYRRSGFARRLFRAVGVDLRSRFEYACKTAVVSKLARKIPLARWNPIGARYDRDQRKALDEHDHHPDR